MANRVPLIINTTANQIQELALGDCLDLTASGIHNAGVITATKFVGDGSLLTNIGGGSAALQDLADDLTPQLGGNLDINGKIINGSGSIVVTGGIQATSFTGDLIGNATSATTANSATTATTATNAAGLTGSPAIQVASVVATGHIQADTVSVASTLTYEDVTNIDSVGVVTARTGIKVLAGGINAIGVTTSTSFDGALDATDLTSGTIPDARFPGTLPAVSGANLTGIEAAPTFQATASGAIANGKIIVLNSDATVSAAATTLVSNNVGSAIEISSASNMLNSVWISDTTIVIVWSAANDPKYTYMAAGTVSGTSITYGTTVQIDDVRGYTAGLIWDKSVNAGVVFIGDSWNAESKYYGFTVSGNTVSPRAHASSGYLQDSGEKRCIRAASNGKGGFAFVYITSNGYIATKAGTLNSSADISVGGNSNTWSGYNADSSQYGKATCDIAYNPDLGTATSSSFGVFAITNSQAGNGAILSDVNDGGTSHTLNGFTGLVSLVHDPGIALTYNTEFNCFYSVYRVGSSNYSRTWTAQSNGTSVQDLASLLVEGANVSSDYYGVDYSPTTKKAYITLTTGSKIQAYEISFASNSSITASSLQPLTAANTDTKRTAMAANNTEGKVYVAVSDPSSPFYIKSHIWQTEMITTNVTANNFLGFSAAAYTNGQTVTIKTVGNVDANQTGLTTASKYYVTNRGELSLTADDPSVYAGLALNSTSIAVKFPV